ncbi:MAG: hypothetical protein CM1200mP32_09030 [Methanobacteriota archaeon]|nr:MAG: hypothetical protein CM1200mP32_09030 [Euryarchaeota archaeon]
MAVGWAVFRKICRARQGDLGDITDYPRFFLMPPTALVEADEHGEQRGRAELLPRTTSTTRWSWSFPLGEDLENPGEMCVGNDTTNRTRQTLAKKKGWPWLEGKGFVWVGSARDLDCLGNPRPVEICLGGQR